MKDPQIMIIGYVIVLLINSILDPIDGTKGFISNAQFAIGLAYVQNGQPVIGIVGKPQCDDIIWRKRWTK